MSLKKFVGTILPKFQVFHTSSNCMDIRNQSAGTYKRYETEVRLKFGTEFHGGSRGQAYINR